MQGSTSSQTRRSLLGAAENAVTQKAQANEIITIDSTAETQVLHDTEIMTHTQHSRGTQLPRISLQAPQNNGSPAELSPSPLVGRLAREERETKLAAQEARWKSREAQRARHEASSSSQQQQQQQGEEVTFEADSNEWAESIKKAAPPHQGAFIPRERRATNARPQLVNPPQAAAPAPPMQPPLPTPISLTYGAQVPNHLPANQGNTHPSLPSSSTSSEAREARKRAAEIQKAALLAKRRAVTQEPTGHGAPQHQPQQLQHQPQQAQQLPPQRQVPLQQAPALQQHPQVQQMPPPPRTLHHGLPQQTHPPLLQVHPLYKGECPSCLASFASIHLFIIAEQEKHVGDCFCADL